MSQLINAIMAKDTGYLQSTSPLFNNIFKKENED